VARCGSILSKEASSSESKRDSLLPDIDNICLFVLVDKSASYGQTSPPSSEYLAADMYDYTIFSHYDIEATITAYRLPQPSAFEALKPDPPAPKK
jgi:hypothetical protein